MNIILKLSRFLYVLQLPTFRDQHFIYAKFVVVTVPAWTCLAGIGTIATAILKMTHPVLIIQVYQ